ncbi:alanyl-tRNA editing protein [Salinigranum halophilum]|uniref:alanyl-tRNA editing protein n=1 Tax=Salinigranum halophilum TaxID=2565931 RepID=UPI0010A8281B|nr:DHHA1 domain-containing protein [Salinigranum halophilum]
MYSRAPQEPEVRTFEADVTAVEGSTVVLDRTYFYPEGGGQPADRGTLAGEDVVDVQARDGRVEHTLAAAPEDVATVGETVEARIDDDFRTYCMRAHTASHALYGAGRRLLDDLGYGGFGITDEKVRVDFATSTDVDDAVLVELERLVNRAVWDSRAVSWAEIPTEDARARADVAFNTKTEGGVMADSDSVRVVTIDGWDVAACGGTHVSNTREIGPVSVLERSNPGEGLTRVEFAVGDPGIDHRAAVHGAALDAARELGVSVGDLPEEVASLRTENARLSAALADLEAERLAEHLRSFDAVERAGTTWRVGTVSGADANAVGDVAKRVVDDGVVAAVGDGDRPFVVVASGGTVHAGDVVDSVTGEFGGGGGGGPPFAQGGGLDAAPDEVVAFLRDAAPDAAE